MIDRRDTLRLALLGLVATGGLTGMAACSGDTDSGLVPGPDGDADGDSGIQLVSSDVKRAAGDPSLLDAAAREGMDVPFSCKSGVCSTCRCKLIEGQVRMDKNFALDKADVAAGFILSCQAHPLTDKVVISFDER